MDLKEFPCIHLKTNLVLISVELKVDVNKLDELDINKVEGVPIFPEETAGLATVDTPEQSVPL
jgi:hypothetical protein